MFKAHIQLSCLRLYFWYSYPAHYSRRLLLMKMGLPGGPQQLLCQWDPSQSCKISIFFVGLFVRLVFRESESGGYKRAEFQRVAGSKTFRSNFNPRKACNLQQFWHLNWKWLKKRTIFLNFFLTTLSNKASLYTEILHKLCKSYQKALDFAKFCVLPFFLPQRKNTFSKMHPCDIILQLWPWWEAQLALDPSLTLMFQPV